MQKTIFTPGASSGLGKATAKLFQQIPAKFHVPCDKIRLGRLERKHVLCTEKIWSSNQNSCPGRNGYRFCRSFFGLNRTSDYQDIEDKRFEQMGLMMQNASTAEQIAYKLGFEHLQSFNKLFKKKANVSL